MYLMRADEMMTLDATVTGTVDGPSYDPNELSDGDMDTVVKTASGSMSLAIAGTSMSVNGGVIAGHNLGTGQVVGLSGLGNVTMPTAPPGGIRYNGFLYLASPVTLGSSTLSVSGGPAGGVRISEALIGLFRTVLTMPPRSGMPSRGFEIIPNDEYGGLSYSNGARARSYGGTALLDDSMKLIMEYAYLASEENSKPTVIVPFEDVNDAWVVRWVTFNPQQDSPGVWAVEAEWEEFPVYAHGRT